MSKRLLAIIGLVAALGWGTPFLMADHGEKDKHQHGNKHNDRDDDAWERRDGYEYRVYGGSTTVPGVGSGEKDRLGQLRAASGPSQEIRMPRLRVPGPSPLLLPG